jgi:hypothetical protein
MNRALLCTVGVAAFVVAATGFAGKLANSSFETDFGQRANQNVWGDFGDAWGEAYQVTAGTGNYLKKARTDSRILLINVPPGSWDGAWQQIPWGEKSPFTVEGFYQIRGGDLPTNCVTFLKVEFYDGNDAVLGSAGGDRFRSDTRGQWLRTTLSGETPEGTAAIRFVVIAGDNAGGEPILDRIYWDDINTVE